KMDAPKLNFDTAKDCVAALQSPNQDTRFQAWTKLHQMGDKAETELKKLRADKDLRMQARAFFLLAPLKGKYLDGGLSDKNEDIRCAALRYLRSARLDVIPAVKKLVNDPS